MTATLKDVKREGGQVNLNDQVRGSHHNRADATGRPRWWFRRARTGATLAACLYVAVWSALLGNFADDLTIGQEVLMAVAVIVSGVLIWMAVRALILQQRFLARQESMEALEESRAFARILMDNLPAAIWLKTLDHRYQAANLMWAHYNPARPALEDHELSHLLGHTDRELFELERAREFEQTDDLVVATGHRWERDYDEFDGESHMKFHVVKMPVFDIRGSVASVAGIGFDITEMRRNELELKKSREQLDAFLSGSTEHICMVGLDRRITLANPRLCEFLGMSAASLVGRDAIDVLALTDRSRGAAFFDRLLLGRPESLEVFDILTASGSVRQVEVSGALVRTEESPDMVVIIGRDTTGHKRSHAEE
ncbi:MAG: PAS domain-containing protein [Candidatus Cryosericum sp.]